MQSYEFDSKRYYLLNDINDHHHKSFKGIRGYREFIEHHKLTLDEYVSARRIKDVWTVSDGLSKRVDKFFVRTRWIRDYKTDGEAEDEPVESSEDAEDTSDHESDSELTEDDEASEQDDSDDDTATANVAPPVISVKEREQFKDTDGNAIEIETRGIRDKNGCYFLMEDVSTGFEMPSLHKTLLNKKGKYVEDKHYCYFNVPTANRSSKATKYKRKLFLTFPGMTKLMFTSKNKTVKEYTDWANKILFAMQMGTEKQRTTVASNAMRVPYQAALDMLSKSARPVPGFYILRIGLTEELRKKYNIPKSFKGDWIVHKFGRTGNLRNRFLKHGKKYVTVGGCDMYVTYYSIIDPKFLSKVETEIKHYLIKEGYKLDNELDVELTIFPDNKRKTIIDACDKICKPYVGTYEKVLKRLKRRNKEIELLKERIEKKDAVIDKKDAVIEKKETEIELLKERHQRQLEDVLNQLSKERDQRELADKNARIAQLELELATKNTSKAIETTKLIKTAKPTKTVTKSAKKGKSKK